MERKVRKRKYKVRMILWFLFFWIVLFFWILNKIILNSGKIVFDNDGVGNYIVFFIFFI